MSWGCESGICKLSREQYSEGVLVTALVTGDSSVKDEARVNAIPECMRFNIIENEVRNVI